MDAARFTYEYTASGWQLQVDEPGLGGPLEGVFRYELRLGDLPADLAVVGHCRVMGTWCVFARDQGSPVFRGIALPGDRYAAHGYDPFAVAAELLVSRSARDAQRTGQAAGPLPALGPESDSPYLAEAHRRFMLGGLPERQSLYCSVLPPGLSRRLSPLSTFVLDGGRPALDPDASAADGGSPGEPAAASATQPIPFWPTAAPGPPDLAAVPVTPGSPLLHQSSLADRVPAAEREVDGALARAALTIELEKVQREISRRLRVLWVALLVATALLAASLAAGLWWTSKRLQRLDHTSPPPAEAGTSGTGGWLP